MEEARTAHAVGEAARDTLAGLREAADVVLASRACNGRTPVARFLSCRLDRLAIAADEIATAAAANDMAALRRGAVQFRALAEAMWKVQLAVCEIPSISGLSALGPGPARRRAMKP
ncbi:hypothetical protein ACGFNU_47585 [Spirillospora sp. NPDC048911]|uniref:hypothetical protein n=1 Tax=Spirillospora sp. NPDC048911 TaxID=3364527 RepID=UPI0037154FE5